jgi:hypothetical protein
MFLSPRLELSLATTRLSDMMRTHGCSCVLSTARVLYGTQRTHARGPAAACERPERAHIVLFDLRLRDACGRGVTGAEARRRWPSRSRKEARRLTRGLARASGVVDFSSLTAKSATRKACRRRWTDLPARLPLRNAGHDERVSVFAHVARWQFQHCCEDWRTHRRTTASITMG